MLISSKSMNSIIKEQLKKVKSVVLEFNDTTTSIFIPKSSHICTTLLNVGSAYIISLNDELEDDIIEKNHNVYPKFKDYKVELLEVVDHWYKFAGIAQVDGIDLHSEYFYYWLKEGSFTILKEEI